MMTKHRTTPIPHTFREWTVARRKGVKVRYQDLRTAKMGPWVTDPVAAAARHDRERLAYREARRAMRDRTSYVAGYVEDMMSRTRDQLVEAAKRRNVKHASKANKTTIATALAEASYASYLERTGL